MIAKRPRGLQNAKEKRRGYTCYGDACKGKRGTDMIQNEMREEEYTLRE